MPPLRPIQIVGVAAVLLFGTRVVLELAEPRRDPFNLPGAMPMNSALVGPGEAAGSGVIAGSDASQPVSPIERGSPAARDDLYCSGVLYAAAQADADPLSALHARRLDYVFALGLRGAARLRQDGLTGGNETAAIADAHSTKALHDVETGTPRIPVETCMERGAKAFGEQAPSHG